MKFGVLLNYNLCYIASPYTKYLHGIDQAYKDVCAVAAVLITHGVKVFAPICHSHSIATHGNINPLNHNMWLAADEPMMDAADALVIVKLDGWNESYGVDYEVDVFKAADKDIFYLNPNTMELSLEHDQ